MSNLKKVRLEDLVDVMVSSTVDEQVFTGYTVRQEVDLEGVSRDFLEEEETYYRVTEIHGGTMYVSEAKLISILLAEAELEAESGDIYAHGYPEARLTPSNHGEESQEAFVGHYSLKFEELIEEALWDML